MSLSPSLILVTLIPILEGDQAFDTADVLEPKERMLISTVTNTEKTLRKALEKVHPLRLPNNKVISMPERKLKLTQDKKLSNGKDAVQYVLAGIFHQKFIPPDPCGIDLKAAAFTIATLPHATPILIVWE
jgi:hypothetical protein